MTFNPRPAITLRIKACSVFKWFRGGWGELSGKLLRLPSLFAAVCLFALDFKWLSMSSLLTWQAEGAGQLALPNINACKAAMRSKVNKSNNNYKEQGGQLLKKKGQAISVDPFA